jgi:hypothetical protein
MKSTPERAHKRGAAFVRPRLASLRPIACMSPDQCRQARDLLRWSRYDLAKAADAPLWFVAMFEDGKEGWHFYMDYKDSMQKALEARGFEFPFGLIDGEIMPLEIVYSPNGKDGLK